LNTGLNKNVGISLFSKDFIRIYFRKLIIFLNDDNRTVKVRHTLLKMKNLIMKLKKIIFQYMFIRKYLDINIFHVKNLRKL
jgi:hypothetical protein